MNIFAAFASRKPLPMLVPATVPQPAPAVPAKENIMDNPVVVAATSVEKGIMWVIHTLQNAGNVASTLSKLSGPTIAALQAVFYDVMKTALSAESAAAAGAEGNLVGAAALSETTIGLIKNLASDVKAGEGTIVADLKSLGIIK